MSNNYIIITPVKNEEKYIKFTLDSVLNQSSLPVEWIIVNDGSTDRTAEIVEQYRSKTIWIKLINMKTFEEQRMGGNKVVRAFNAGYNAITNREWDFIVKLDGDLTLPNNYFEEIFKTFSTEKNLGICGGRIVNKYSDNKLVVEKSDQYQVRGALKTIKRKCWDDIGGFKEVWAWDGLDVMEARFNGWNTKSIDIKVIHHRPTSSAYNPVKQSYRNGYESYKLGNDIILTLIRTFFRFKNKPYFIVGFAFLTGFLMAMVNRESKIVSKDLELFIRRFQYSRIFNFKSNLQKLN